MPKTKYYIRNGQIVTDPTDAERSIDEQLTGVNDGKRPEADQYEGTADPTSRHHSEMTWLRSKAERATI